MILRKTTASNLLILILITVFYGCSAPKEESKTAPKQVLLETNYGEILLELSDKTPLHRDNFLKLVEAGDFDSLLFHRVIEGFVIQGGDPESKYANPGDTLGEGDKNYTVPAELDTSLFHKRGALGAAREGRPDRASSAMQFYIVQSNKSIADSLFAKAENRINSWLQTHHFINTPENKAWLNSLNALLDAKELDAFYSQMDSVTALSKTLRILITMKFLIVIGRSTELPVEYPIWIRTTPSSERSSRA